MSQSGTFGSGGGGESGALVLIETQTGATNLFEPGRVFDNTVITTTYKNYLIIFRDHTNFGSGTALEAYFSINNGSTYVTTNYTGGSLYNNYNSATLTNVNQTARITLTPNSSNSTTQGWSGYMYLTGLQQSSPGGPSWYGEAFGHGPTGDPIMIRFSGKNTGSLTVNTVQLLASDGGAFTGGTVSLYGIRE